MAQDIPPFEGNPSFAEPSWYLRTPFGRISGQVLLLVASLSVLVLAAVVIAGVALLMQRDQRGAQTTPGQTAPQAVLTPAGDTISTTTPGATSPAPLGGGLGLGALPSRSSAPPLLPFNVATPAAIAASAEPVFVTSSTFADALRAIAAASAVRAGPSQGSPLSAPSPAAPQATGETPPPQDASAPAIRTTSEAPAEAPAQITAVAVFAPEPAAPEATNTAELLPSAPRASGNRIAVPATSVAIPRSRPISGPPPSAICSDGSASYTGLPSQGCAHHAGVGIVVSPP
jgi:hypothetical protein